MNRIEALQALAAVLPTYSEKLATINAALSMHRVVLPDDDIAYARMQSYSGQLLLRARAGSSEARSLLTEALEALERELGEDSQELVATLLALGDASLDMESVRRQRLPYYGQALKIAQQASEAEISEDIADIQLHIGQQLRRQPAGYRDALPYLRSALEGFEKLFGADHVKTALAALIVGQASIAVNDGENARIYSERAVEFFTGKPAYTAYLIRARQALMAVYLDQNDDDLYTEQLMELGRVSEGLMDRVEYSPIVKYAPDYPLEAASRRAEGYVVVQYTVDEEGRTRDLIVVESASERGRGEMFHKSAVDSARKYRYVPRFENGIPVSVPGVRTIIRFELEN
jgi:TonB family protein